MARCNRKRCTTFSRNSINDAWKDIRDHFGPITDIGSDIYNKDLSEWTAWAIENGKSTNNVGLFGKWLIWLLSVGTSNYGNLPSRLDNHEGICGIRCPYDSRVNVDRARIMLSIPDPNPLPIQSDHGDYYMKVANRLSLWGFECTYPGCTYRTDNGKPYFYA